jgi:hypothetical protein
MSPEETDINASSILNKAVDQSPVKPAPRFERKFFILPKNIGFAYTLLRQVCRPDREYPQSQVNSLYFDTNDLDEYMRSASGDFKKDKVRIRWYDSIADDTGMVPVYIELKSRQGFASSKQRQKFSVPLSRLMTEQLGSGIVDRTVLINTLASFGYFLENPLRPIIVTSYRRYRFNEMQTGVRVSLDYNIKALAVAPELGRREQEIRLQGGVIEVKGSSLELPITLRRIRLLDTDWARFSKYSYCIEAFLSEPSGVGRFWPSGRMMQP